MKKRGGLAEWQDQNSLNSPRNEREASGADDNTPAQVHCKPQDSSPPLEIYGSTLGADPRQSATSALSVMTSPLPAFTSLEQHAARAVSPLQRAGSPGVLSNIDSEGRMEAAAALVEELSSLKGQCNFL